MGKGLLSVLTAVTFCMGPGSAAFAAGEAEESGWHFTIRRSRPALCRNFQEMPEGPII